MDIKHGKVVKVKKVKKERNGRWTILALFIGGVASAFVYAADWGADHHFEGRPVIAQMLDLQIPVTIEDNIVEEIKSPLSDEVVEQEFTPIEQKVMDRWGYKDGIMALAIFDCGESGLDQYAVSPTGDLGIAQINWSAHKSKVWEMDRTSADLLTDVDFNLDIAYMIWEGAGKSWHDWSGYNNGAYLRCL